MNQRQERTPYYNDSEKFDQAAEPVWRNLEESGVRQRPNPPVYSKKRNSFLHFFFLSLSGYSLGLLAGIYLAK